MKEKSRQSAGRPTWVPVADEPLHHIFFSDDRVRLYEADIAPGEQTAFHRNDRHTLYVVIADGKSETEAFPGASTGAYRFPRTTRLRQLIALGFTRAVFGWTDLHDGVWFIMPARGRLVIHRVRAATANQAALRMIGVELVPHARGEPRGLVMSSGHHRPDYEDECVRVWKLPRSPILYSTYCGVFVITRGAQAGEFIHFDAGSKLTVASHDGEPHAIAIETK